jgi:uncharacterized protein (TIGR01777 family)
LRFFFVWFLYYNIMKIILPGGSGQIGTALAARLHSDGHQVVVLSRNPSTVPWQVIQWDTRTLGSWATELDEADVVINLAGRSVNCRYTVANREEIKHSRIRTTELIGQAINLCQSPPCLWLNSSTATIYSHRYDAPNDEASGILGSQDTQSPATWRFSVDVAENWEQAADKINLPSTRLIKLRTAMVMGPGRGGVFDVFTSLARKGLGGTLGDGRQFVSWIHEEDFIRAILWLIDNNHLSGSVNICAPRPLPNRDFMRALRQACGASFGLPASKCMLEIGTFFMRTETELILKSRRVVPSRLIESGFIFNHPTWPEAVEDLHRLWKVAAWR